MRRWGVFCLLLLLAGISGGLADDITHPLASKPTPLDPNQELVDAPLPGQKPAAADATTPEGDASTLTPFYVRTGIGLSFVTTVDYPDFGISGDVPFQPGFATGLMLGAQFHDNIAFEIEGGLLSAPGSRE